MSPFIRAVVPLFSLVGIVPLAWLVTLLMYGKKREPTEWMVASALAVSFIADVFGFLGNGAVVSNAYPVTQAAMLGAIVLTAREALGFTLLLIAVAYASVLIRQGAELDVFLRTVAFGGVAGMNARFPKALRPCIVVLFGGGLLAWYAYVSAPNWWTWGSVQGVRLVGTLMFCRSVA